jgi:hypothetical protein
MMLICALFRDNSFDENAEAVLVTSPLSINQVKQ